MPLSTGFTRKQGYRVLRQNHSLRSTAALHLYQAGVDEQLVMERTGHRSLEGVRSYKRTCDEQRIALSDILNGKKKHIRITFKSLK
jgi:integrase